MHTQPKTIIFSLFDHKKDLQKHSTSLKEAELLVATYGGKVVDVITQNASHRKSGTYMGTGKLHEIKEQIEENDIKILVINDHIKAGQLYTIQQMISPSGEVHIWDRTQLVLQIFKKNATTSVAKLQIELAQLRHRGPELSGIGTSLSQQGGGIGTRGIGETQTEIMRRHWQEEIRKVEERIKKATQGRRQQVRHRKMSQVPTVSIIGYTNAGKTTLFNSIGKKKDKVKNALFATLDSSVSTLFLQGVGKEIYITDTIGFIQDLPHELVDAFRSTLYETVHADILLHVVDCSDEYIDLKIETVEDLLQKMNLETKNIVLIFNKSDKLNQTKKEDLEIKYGERKHIFVSSKSGEGVENLINLIEKELIRAGLDRAKHLEYLDNM